MGSRGSLFCLWAHILICRMGIKTVLILGLCELSDTLQIRGPWPLLPCGCHSYYCSSSTSRLPPTPPRSVEKLPPMKLVPSSKELGVAAGLSGWAGDQCVTTMRGNYSPKMRTLTSAEADGEVNFLHTCDFMDLPVLIRMCRLQVHCLPKGPGAELVPPSQSHLHA